ncbi:beta-galactosidase [Saliterribacillus persicus]|uniref:Beta-galactosidase n=1 Tax=Saliterribacillus persicus TaxID=930114 RepID=A0A368YEH5_9BACI|nr:beta-galactosidase [Saliterribacillus persicus]RCW77287.1 beta-galactosidase [Saliterribacillus persicus]
MINKIINEEKITLGVCYYPEHWPEDLWEDDFKRMKELGFTYVRMSEFAWTIFEPKEGHFEFDLFDKAIALAGKYNLKVILGTPTATPPVWLTEKYPEVLNVSHNGVQFKHGSRRHYNYNSKKYQELSATIVTEMVTHYRDNPYVVGWQIDNELNCEISEFYAEADHMAFKNWAKEKYQSLDALNEAWGTVFWNQTYTSWDQVSLTLPTVNDTSNPHQALDEKRFFSDSTINFAKIQADIIRKLTKDQWVTTNGMFGHLDNHQLTEDIIDFYAYDSYPNFSKVIKDTSSKPLRDRKWSLNLSTVRGFGGNFAIFEQQSGPGGWVNRLEQPAPKPGQVKLWSYQSIAHGSEMVLYFRWRTATKGTEMYWHGINDYHNLPNRRIAEIETFSKEIEKVGPALYGSTYQAKVAILTDYQNSWDGEMDKWYGNFIGQSKEAWFKAFQYNHIPVDLTNINKKTTVDHLSKYDILIYPHAAILTKETAKLLTNYVEQGGKIVFGCRTGYKDLTGQPYQKAFPGYIADLVGITVSDFTLVGAYEAAPKVSLFNKDEQEALGFNEILHADNDDVEILGHFTNDYYAGEPALTKRNHGKGTAYYFGGVFSYEIAEKILADLKPDDYSEYFDLPESVELAVRKNDEKTFFILLNYASDAQPMKLKQPMIDCLTDEEVTGSLTLTAYDVKIYSFS